MADDAERLEIEITLDDQASEALRNLGKIIDDTGDKVDALGGASTRTNISNMAFLHGLTSVEHGIRGLDTGLAHFLGTDNQVVKSVRDLENGMRLIIAPMQIYKGITTMLDTESIKLALTNERLMLTFGGLLSAVGAVMAIYGAMNAKTDEEKTRYSALAGVLIGLTAAQWAYVAAKSSAWVAETLGAAGPIIVAAIAGMVAAVSGFAATRFMAEGGIITRPIVAGEAGPEAIIPLPLMAKMLEGGGKGDTYITVQGNADRRTVDDMRRMLDRKDMEDRLRHGEMVVKPG